MGKHVPLPEGYRVEEIGGFLRLFDPQGALLVEEPQGPAAASVIEERAWREAWKQIDRALKEELAALREGTRQLHELPRLRQYMRMLDAVARPPIEVHERPHRSDVVSWLALAASAAAIALVVWTTPPRIARAPETVPQTTTSAPSVAGPSVERPGPATSVRPAPSENVQVSPGTRLVKAPPRSIGPVRAKGSAAGWPAVSGYAVSFGEFTSRTSAEIRMRVIRSKGYLVYVARVGESFHVVTRPYRTRAQAERLAKALQDIGLPAREQFTVTFEL